MRTTRAKTTDYERMLGFAATNVGLSARELIDAFAAKRKIVSHRSGKVFWALVDDGAIRVAYDASGRAYVVATTGVQR